MVARNVLGSARRLEHAAKTNLYCLLSARSMPLFGVSVGAEIGVIEVDRSPRMMSTNALEP